MSEHTPHLNRRTWVPGPRAMRTLEMLAQVLPGSQAVHDTTLCSGLNAQRQGDEAVTTTALFRRDVIGVLHEMDDQQHRDLARALAGLRGMVVVSGYRCPLYDELFDGWQRIDAAAHADGARDRVESLWLSRGCPQVGLFDTHRLS